MEELKCSNNGISQDYMLSSPLSNKEMLIEVISWLDQESLMNMSVVSKHSNHIIRNEEGNQNKILPILEIKIPSNAPEIYFPNFCNIFANEENIEKMQSYRVLRIRGSSVIKEPYHTWELDEKMREIKTKLAFTTLELDQIPWCFVLPFKHRLRDLRVVQASDAGISSSNLYSIMRDFGYQMEKLTISSNNEDIWCYRYRNRIEHVLENLKEIEMDNSKQDLQFETSLKSARVGCLSTCQFIMQHL